MTGADIDGVGAGPDQPKTAAAIRYVRAGAIQDGAVEAPAVHADTVIDDLHDAPIVADGHEYLVFRGLVRVADCVGASFGDRQRDVGAAVFGRPHHGQRRV